MADPTLRDQISSIERVRATLADEARGSAIAKLAERGKLSARVRIARLVDSDSFSEIGSLVAAEEDGIGEGPVRTRSPADGVVVGTATIGGRPVMVFSQDFSVFGGSIGRLGSAKIQRALQVAITRGVPLIMILDGGGHRIQDGQDARHFANANATFHHFARASGWIPMVALMLGAGFAGPTNYAGMADLVVMVRGLSTMGIAGPVLVKAGTGEDIDGMALGGADIQVDQQGIADLGVDSEDEAFAATRRFLSYLPGNAQGEAPMVPQARPVARIDDRLLDLVPVSTRKAYDVRKVLRLIADSDSYFELKPTFAGNIVTALARLGGRPVGFVANQPLRLGGMLNSNACDKGAHFIALCDAFGLPLVSFIDVPGFSIGSGAERTSLGRRSAKLLFEWGHATVPRISVVLRKGYGLGYFAMAGGRSFAADACFAWPSAEICAMSIEGAIDVAFRKEYQAAPDPKARRQQMIDETRARIGALRGAEGFGVDDVIDPRDTRRRLVDVLDSTLRRRPNDHPPKFRSIAPI
ncbi:MAG: acyl-CoA carboxylase [Alphaproteobacteria bacterium]|nr:acyl-CoA carboxylase [Alphaproteobacteria bacterium]MBV8406240.1 acyl-CoA carboxylase [Alphaproteobacteria bacterium]